MPLGPAGTTPRGPCATRSLSPNMDLLPRSLTQKVVGGWAGPPDVGWACPLPPTPRPHGG